MRTDLEWAVWRWHDEVANRPLDNIHRSALDTTWRQVIRHFGGDPDDLCGPCPFCERMHSEISASGFDCPPIGGGDAELHAAATKLLAIFDEQKQITTAERIITGKSDKELRDAGNAAINELRRAVGRAHP